MSTNLAAFLEEWVKKRWQFLAFSEPIDRFQDHLYWFRLCADGENHAVFFAFGNSKEEARERLECSLRVLSHQFLTLWEFDSGEVLGNVPACPVHSLHTLPETDYLLRILRKWKCPERTCEYRVVTWKLRGHGLPDPYCLASAGTVANIHESGLIGG